MLDLERERSDIQEALASLPGRENALLDADAPDDAFAGLDLEKKRCERTLERLDRREAALVQLAERYQAETQQRTYADLRQRYLEASEALADDASRLENQLAAVNRISQEASALGLSPMQQPTLPPVGFSAGAPIMFAGHLVALRNQRAVAEQAPVQLPRQAPRLQTYAIRFHQFTPVGLTAYQAGQVAWFPAPVCDHLVAAGKAELMKKGMPFDATAATWGVGIAPLEPKPKPIPQHERDE